MPIEITKETIERLSAAIEQRDQTQILAELTDLHASDISVVLEEFGPDDCKYVMQDVLEANVGADILVHLEEDTQRNFLKHFEPQEIAYFLDYTDSDDGADLLNNLPVKTREEVIAGMKNQERAHHIVDLLHYEEDCAGGLMAKELIKANINWNVRQCIEEIRRQAEKVDKILTIYVVDDKNVLQGRVSIKRIILSKDDTLIKDIYVSNIEAVQTYMDEEEVADMMQRYDLEAMPVINVQGKLLGRITIDDILDVITEQAELDRQIMSGISEHIEEDDSIWMLSRARLPWLLVGMVGGLLGAQFLGFFEQDLVLVPAMAFFIPLITATGGNVGIQSSTIMVQSLASSPLVSEPPLRRLFKVLMVAILNGLVISASVFTFNLFFSSANLGLIVSIALFCVVLLASIMGTITPIVLDKVGINPALASGPFITTANDLLGLAVYFLVARSLYDF